MLDTWLSLRPLTAALTPALSRRERGFNKKPFSLREKGGDEGQQC